MQMCGYCMKVYDESEYTKCPFCSDDKGIEKGWFKEKYGDDAHPVLPIESYCRIYDELGEEAANDTLRDVQDGKISVKTLGKYLFKK